MITEPILLCGECCEGIVHEVTCDTCKAVECTYYEIDQDDMDVLEMMSHKEKLIYLLDYTIEYFPI